MQIVSNDNVSSRLFHGWAMAYVDGSGQSDIPLSFTSRPTSRTGRDMVEMLRYLVGQTDQKAPDDVILLKPLAARVVGASETDHC